MLRVGVYDVAHGLCIFIRTPNNYGVLIDCGRSTEFSPTWDIHQRELPSLRQHQGHALALMIVTHPHGDHLRDIDMVSTLLRPAVLRGWIYPDWRAVRGASKLGEQEFVDAYIELRREYSQPICIADLPDWGMALDYSLGLTPQEALDLAEDKFVNNSSIIVMFEYAGRKFLVGGDAETAAWEELLRRPAFRNAVQGTDFFITPHHGHESGFCPELFGVMGKPFLNIASVQEKDPSVATQYSQAQYAKGADLYGRTRSLLTTRTHGSIAIQVEASGSATVGFDRSR